MTPYPAQTDRATIVDIASDIIDREGVENLSMNRIASSIGIKAPSLYQHVAGKKDLLQAVIESTFRKMFKVYEVALESAGQDPSDRLQALFHAHRDFAHAHPNTYILAYTTTDPELRTDPAWLEQQAIVVQQVMAQLVGQERSLAALRGALALVHGFVMLELKEQLQRGGDLSQAFDLSISAYLRGWE